MSDRWKVGLLAREAFGNTLPRAARLWPAVMIAVLLGSAPVALLAFDQAGLTSEVDSLTSQGMGVIIFSEVSPERSSLITRESCEHLSSSSLVEAAGIVIASGEVDIAPFARRAASQRASITLFPEFAEVDILIGDTIVSREGTFRIVSDGSPRLARTAPSSREGLGAVYQVTGALLPDDHAARQCVAVLNRFASADQFIHRYSAQLDVIGNAVVARQVLTPTSDPVARYVNRPGSWSFVAVGLVGGSLTGLLSRSRVSELAAYRLSGTSRRSLLILLALENLFIAGVLVTSAALSAVALSSVLLDYRTGLVGGVSAGAAFVLLACATTADIAFRKPTDLAKDR